MSLSNAMLEIAKNIEDHLAEMGKEYADVYVVILRSYARQIRAAVTAAEPGEFGHEFSASRPTKTLQTFDEFAEREERAGANMVEIVGGNSDGDFVSIDPTMPPLAKTMIAGQVHVLSVFGKLHFSQEETEKLTKKQSS